MVGEAVQPRRKRVARVEHVVEAAVEVLPDRRRRDERGDGLHVDRYFLNEHHTPPTLGTVAFALQGLSAKLLLSHHQNNYGGAVKRLNAIRAQLQALPFAAVPGFQLNGLKREELIASNSMLLHELYFDSLGGSGQAGASDRQSLAQAFGSFDAWLWGFVEGCPIDERRADIGAVPASTPLSDALSKALKQRGFRFVGSTICYAFMQSAGLVNDHLTGCFRHAPVHALSSRPD